VTLFGRDSGTRASPLYCWTVEVTTDVQFKKCLLEVSLYCQFHISCILSRTYIYICTVSRTYIYICTLSRTYIYIYLIGQNRWPGHHLNFAFMRKYVSTYVVWINGACVGTNYDVTSGMTILQIAH
jgi:hypothetical protein